MRNILFCLFLSLFIFSCTREKTSEKESMDSLGIAKDTVNRDEGRFKDGGEAIEANPEKEAAEIAERFYSTLQSLPKKWIFLKSDKKDTVILFPCGNSQASGITIRDETTEQPKLDLRTTGGELQTYLILEAKKDTGKVELKLLRYYEGGTPSQTENLNIYLNEKKDLSTVESNLLPATQSPYLLTSNDKALKKYKLVKQKSADCK